MPAQSLSIKEQALFDWTKAEAERNGMGFSEFICSLLDNARSKKLVNASDWLELEKKSKELYARAEELKFLSINAKMESEDRAVKAKREAELLVSLEKLTHEELTEKANDWAASLGSTEREAFTAFLRSRNLTVGAAYLAWVREGRAY